VVENVKKRCSGPVCGNRKERKAGSSAKGTAEKRVKDRGKTAPAIIIGWNILVGLSGICNWQIIGWIVIIFILSLLQNEKILCFDLIIWKSTKRFFVISGDSEKSRPLMYEISPVGRNDTVCRCSFCKKLIPTELIVCK
jgi:hypothetical protein